MPALGAATSVYAFVSPATGPFPITVELWLRRVGADVAILQQWGMPDMLVAWQTPLVE